MTIFGKIASSLGAATAITGGGGLILYQQLDDSIPEGAILLSEEGKGGKFVFEFESPEKKTFTLTCSPVEGHYAFPNFEWDFSDLKTGRASNIKIGCDYSAFKSSVVAEDLREDHHLGSGLVCKYQNREAETDSREHKYICERGTKHLKPIQDAGKSGLILL
ncbi:hypothetical protein MHLP_03890 [Candidatus Mycoplasma haematolamae str. Purdue]|uniref:Uncharacterized protein n=1 Tax=Mycoplasma haematolamae (strain Purdue) TaxID=1212765 RepID=I7BKE5_MYCHA|nr:hypothetical protein [Candidatus Mycoplasma haematolamae]AFO52358.1 hypothetical protein MHLP_03890 [Candidatus Mycoplasma haematolamae str. Purdue]